MDGNSERIIFDSGASFSVVGNRDLLTDFHEDSHMEFCLANNHTIVSQGVGVFSFRVNNKLLLNIRNVYFLPDIAMNLISLADIASKDVTATFSEENLIVNKDNREYVIATRDPVTRLYIGYSNGDNVKPTKDKIIDCDEDQVKQTNNGIYAVRQLVDLDFPQYIAKSTDKKDLFYYHLRTNHMSIRALDHLIDQGKISANKRDKEARDKVLACPHCKAVNSKKISHNRSTQRSAERRLQRLHLDTLGPIRVDGIKYYITTLIDEFSGFMICVILDTRSVQLSLLREIKVMNNLFPGESVANFRSDNARELPDAELLRDLGVRKEEIPAYTPAMNGRAELYNKFILKQLKLLVLNFPNRQFHLLALFTELVSYCVYTINHTPTNRVPGHLGESPYEIFYGCKYSPQFQQFGIDVLVHINNPIEASSLGVQTSKAITSVVKGFLVGYGQDSNTYWIKVMHGNNPVRLFANVTFLNTMNCIEKYFDLLDEKQREETRGIADTLTRLDEPVNRNDNPENSMEGSSSNAFSHPYPEDIPSFKDIFEGNWGVTTIDDLFDMQSNSVLGVHETDSLLLSFNNSNGVTNCYTMLVKVPSCFTEPDSGQRWSHKLQEGSSGLEPRLAPALGLSESTSKDKIPTPNGGELEKRLKQFPNHSSTLKFNLSEDIDTKKLELGHGGHVLVPESSHPYKVDIGQFGLPVRKKLEPIHGKELNRELVKVPRVIEKLEKLDDSYNPNGKEHLTCLESYICQIGKYNINNSNYNSHIPKQGRISDTPLKFQNPSARELVLSKRKVLDNNTVNKSEDQHHAIYNVERHVDMKDPNWIKAMDDEMKKFHEMKVFEIVDIPRGEKIIPARWVHTYKVDDQKGDNYKLRCVVQGFRQLAGVNFDPSRVSSPVTDLMSIRILTVIAVECNLEIHHVDIKSAYLNSTLPAETAIYVKPPKGVQIEQGKCWRLRKAVYGLKQAGFEWYIHLTDKLKEMGIQSCENSEGLFIKKDGKEVIYIAVYVDDLFIVSSSNEVFNNFLRTLEQKFRLNYLGPVQEYLGVEFIKTPKGYNLSQRKFTKSILDAFELQDCTAKSLPRPPMDSTRFQAKAGTVKDHLQMKTKEVILSGKDLKVYQRGVGMLQWLCMNTRPDIAFATNALGIKASAPTKEDYKMLIHCMKYLKGTIDYGLEYICGNTKLYGNAFILHGFADASFAPPGDRKSISGYAIYLNGNIISWGTKKQRCVTESSMSSEIRALGETTHRILAVTRILDSLELEYRKPILLEDNEPTLKLAYNEQISYSRRLVDITMSYIRDIVLTQRMLGVSYIHTSKNIADVMTKATGIDTFKRLRQALMSNGYLTELNEVLMSHYIGGNEPQKAFILFCAIIDQGLQSCNEDEPSIPQDEILLMTKKSHGNDH